MKLYSTVQVARMVGLSRYTVPPLARELGLGYNYGGGLMFTEAEVEHLRHRQPWPGPSPHPVAELYSAKQVSAMLTGDAHRTPQAVLRFAKRHRLGVWLGRQRKFTPADIEVMRRTPGTGGRPRLKPEE